MRTIQQINADIAALEATYQAARAAAKCQSAMDRAADEGEDVSTGALALDVAGNRYFAALKLLSAELFAATWTGEVLAARRAAWNAEVSKLSGKVSNAVVADIERKLGYTMQDIARAKTMHGL